MNGSETQRIIKIITAVRKHECLWNVNSCDYAKRDKLEIAWNEVAHEIGKSDVFCREKWRNVRTGFLRSIQHQIRKNEDESVPSDYHTVKRKRFYLYDQLAFLLPSAISLEKARKKRKLSSDHKLKIKTHDMISQQDYDDNTLTDYNIIGKFEQQHNDDDEEKAIDEAEEEHHSFEVNANAAADDDEGNLEDDDDCEEILKETFKQTEEAEHLNKNDGYSPTTKKVMSLISQQLNEEINTKTFNENSNSSCAVNNSNQHCNGSSLSNQREETQLLHFFRGCTDDILALDKQKQRLFKKRMLDLIDELHQA